jgi:polyhydroxyalkanoate synthesis repressor PhaR
MAQDQRGGRRRSAKNGDGPVVIKKYANRRLYNTSTSSYVTLEHLCQMVKDDVDFVVYDAKTGDDITRSVLTQIIVEEESKGTNLLPIAFLRQLIGFYGDSMQSVVPRYLEQMMEAFAENQDRLRQQMQETMSGMFPFTGNLEDVRRQNQALMESAMKVFNPFAAEQGQGAPGEEPKQAGESTPPAQQGTPQDAESLAQLRQQVELLRQQLDTLTRQQQESPEETSSEEASKGSGAQDGKPESNAGSGPAPQRPPKGSAKGENGGKPR